MRTVFAHQHGFQLCSPDAEPAVRFSAENLTDRYRPAPAPIPALLICPNKTDQPNNQATRSQTSTSHDEVLSETNSDQ